MLITNRPQLDLYTTYLANTTQQLPNTGIRSCLVDADDGDLVITLPDPKSIYYYLTLTRIDRSANSVLVQANQPINGLSLFYLSASQTISLIYDFITDEWQFIQGYKNLISSAKSLVGEPDNQPGMICYNTDPVFGIGIGFYGSTGSGWQPLAGSSSMINSSLPITGTGALVDPIRIADSVAGRIIQYRTTNWQFANSLISRTIFVDPVGSNTTGREEDPFNPYQTIEAALARAITIGGGIWTIIVRPGNYVVTSNLLASNIYYYFYPQTFISGFVTMFNVTSGTISNFKLMGYAEFNVNSRVINVTSTVTAALLYFEAENMVSINADTINLDATNAELYVKVNREIRSTSGSALSLRGGISSVYSDVIQGSSSNGCVNLSGTNPGQHRIITRLINGTAGRAINCSASQHRVGVFYDEIVGSPTSTGLVVIGGGSATVMYLSGRSIVCTSNFAAINKGSSSVLYIEGATIASSPSTIYAIELQGGNVYMHMGQVRGLRITSAASNTILGNIMQLQANSTNALNVNLVSNIHNIYIGIDQLNNTGTVEAINVSTSGTISLLNSKLNINVAGYNGNAILNYSVPNNSVSALQFSLNMDNVFVGGNVAVFQINAPYLNLNIGSLISTAFADLFSISRIVGSAEKQITINADYIRTSNTILRTINGGGPNQLNGKIFLFGRYMELIGNSVGLALAMDTAAQVYVGGYLNVNSSTHICQFIGTGATTSGLVLNGAVFVQRGTGSFSLISSVAATSVVVYGVFYSNRATSSVFASLGTIVVDPLVV
jgi:hypothetical protein